MAILRSRKNRRTRIIKVSKSARAIKAALAASAVMLALSGSGAAFANAGGCTAIAIRTAVIQDGRLHVQAGAGIVHDSDPGREWDETLNKGRALFRAVAQAASGL